MFAAAFRRRSSAARRPLLSHVRQGVPPRGPACCRSPRPPLLSRTVPSPTLSSAAPLVANLCVFNSDRSGALSMFAACMPNWPEKSVCPGKRPMSVMMDTKKQDALIGRVQQLLGGEASPGAQLARLLYAGNGLDENGPAVPA